MNAKEASALLGLHPNTIYKMIRNGEIKAEKKGKSFDISPEEIDRLQGDNNTVEDVIQSLEKVKSYLKKELEELDRVLDDNITTINRGRFGDVFDAVNYQGRCNTYLKHIDLMEQDFLHGEKMFKITKNGITTKYSKVVNDNDSTK